MSARITRAQRSKAAGITLVELLVAMVIAGILSAMLVAGWMNLQRASAFTVTTNNARATARDAVSCVTSELRGSQPSVLPTPDATATTIPDPEPPLTVATRNDVQFLSAFNSSDAGADGSGLGALRLTRFWLDTSGSGDQKTLYLQRDLNGNGTFGDIGDRSMILADDIVNELIADTTNGTAYTPVFWYAYRDGLGDVHWTDDADSVLDSIVAIRVRLIIDANMARRPEPIDVSTTVRLRNTSSD